MIRKLAELLDLFPGPDNQTRCFAHVLNLIAKSVIRQFDVPKAQQNQMLDDRIRELQALAADIDVEENSTRNGVEAGSNENEDDNMDGWIDERAKMSAEDVETLDESVEPVRFMLVKVISISDSVSRAWLTLPIAAQNCIRNQELFDNHSPAMAQASQRAQAQSPHDAARCQHTMELDI